MTRSRRCLALVLAGAGAAATAACTDSQAKRRAEAAEAIATAVQELKDIQIRAGSESGGEVDRQLNRVIADLARAADGEPGQRAAAARLAGSAHNTLASMAQTRIGVLEADNRARRALAHDMMAAAVELDTVATGLEAINVDPDLDKLARQRGAAQGELGQHGEELASLDGPISTLSEANENDRREAERLRLEADRMRGEAADRGPSEGFEYYEQSLQLDRQADRLEYDIAQREIDLRYNLEPEHQRAESRVARSQASIDTIRSAEQSIEDYGSMLDREARETRAAIAQVQQQVAETIAVIEETSAGPLQELYDQAASNLTKAATNSKAAANDVADDDTLADAARIEAARAYQSLGDVHWARARGLADQVALLQRADDAPVSIDASIPVAALSRQQAEAIEQAGQAYTDAQNVLKRAKGRSVRRELEEMKSNLEQLVAMTEGKAAAPAPAAPAAGAPAAASPQPAAAPQQQQTGAASPQELIEAIVGAGGVEAQARIATDLTHVDLANDQQRGLWSAMLDASRATIQLERALQDKFGVSMIDLGGQMMAGGAADLAGLSAGDVQLGEVSPDRGTIHVTAAGQSEDLTILAVGGRWYFDGNEQFAAVTAMFGGDAGIPKGTAFMKSMGGMVSGLAGRVASGEFASTQAVTMAMMQGTQELMSKMPGQ